MPRMAPRFELERGLNADAAGCCGILTEGRRCIKEVSPHPSRSPETGEPNLWF